MFDSIKRGFSVVGQALDMARKALELFKPSLYGVVVGAIASWLVAVPSLVAPLTVGAMEFC